MSQTKISRRLAPYFCDNPRYLCSFFDGKADFLVDNIDSTLVLSNSTVVLKNKSDKAFQIAMFRIFYPNISKKSVLVLMLSQRITLIYFGEVSFPLFDL